MSRLKDTNIQMLYEIDELDTILKTDKILIYGAGMVSNILVSFLAKKHKLSNVFCVTVSNKEGNPDDILGVPVCQISDVSRLKKDIPIVIATLENKSKSIFYDLKKSGFSNIYAVSNLLYAFIRQDAPSFEYEIFALEKIIKRDIIQIREDVKQIKACIQDDVQYYEQTLSEKDYPTVLKNWYKKKTGEILDLDNPITYNEKIQWIKLYGLTQEMTKLTDKYVVREWIKDKIGEEFLPKLYGVWKDFEQIDFNQLPKQFVIKCNHGCGYNYIVKDKESLDKMMLKNKIKKWLKVNYAYIGGLQLQYANIEPLIIAEEYLENAEDELYDYKFWCFDGKVDFIMFLSERKKMLKMNNFDCEWNLLPFTYDYEQSVREIKRPAKLEKMIKIAETLAEGFPHVRVDLYLLNNGDIKFGEMTFTSANGVCKWSDEGVNKRLGDLIKLNC